MSASDEELIDAACANLKGDAELQFAARSFLRSRLGSTQTKPDADDPADEMIARWHRVDSAKRRIPWKLALALVITIASLGTLLANWSEIVFYKRALGTPMIDFDSYIQTATSDLRKKSYSHTERILLLGDLSKSKVSEQRKALWDLDPGNAAYFSEYAVAYYDDHKKMPPDFLEVSSRLDPDNAFFPYLAASALAKDTNVKKRLSSADRKAGKMATWIIKDEAKLDQALAIADSAANMTKFQTYQREMMLKRLRLLPFNNKIETSKSATFLFSSGVSSFRLRDLGDAFSAKAQDLQAKNNPEDFSDLLKSMSAFYFAQARSEGSMLIDTMILSTDALQNYARFENAASELGFSTEAIKLGEVRAHLESGAASKKARFNSGLSKPYHGRGDIFSEEMISALENQVTNPPSLDLAELLPGSYSDHALASRMLAFALWLLLGFGLALLWVRRFLTTPLTRQLTKRFELLFKWSDYGLMIALGIFLPVAYILAVSRLTPFGARDWSLAGTLWILPAAHFVAMFLLISGISILIARARLKKKASLFGLGLHFSWIGWALVVAVVADVPFIGWIVAGQHFERPWLIAGAAPLAVLLIWIFIPMLRVSFGSPEERLTSSIIGRMLIPIYGWAMLLMLCLAPAFKMEEDYWFRRFELMSFDPKLGPVTRYEHEITRIMKKELREALGL